MKQEQHLLLKDRQQSGYCVPILSPLTAVGQVVCQSIHNQEYGESAASTLARSSRYIYFLPPAIHYYKKLSNNCYRCKRINMTRGVNVISPLRHIAEISLIKGVSLQMDIAGPWTVYFQLRQIG